MTPFIPAVLVNAPQLLARPKGYENRLTDAETEEMVARQNAAIAAEQAKLGRKLTDPERLAIIGTVQRAYWQSRMLPGGYIGPGNQSIDVRPEHGGGRADLDSVVGQKPQSSVWWWSPSVWRHEVPGVVKDGVRGTTQFAADTVGDAVKGVFNSRNFVPLLVVASAVAALYFISRPKTRQ